MSNPLPPLEQLDPEVRDLVVALNELPGIRTDGSCSGHGRGCLFVNLVVEDYQGEGMWLLSRLLCPRYYGLWRHFALEMVHIDVAPWVVFDLNSKAKGPPAYLASKNFTAALREARDRGDWERATAPPKVRGGMGKHENRTTFGVIPTGTVFRYHPDEARLGPRVKVDGHLIVTIEDWKKLAVDGAIPGTVILEHGDRPRGPFRYCEDETPVRVIHSEQQLTRQDT